MLHIVQKRVMPKLLILVILNNQDKGNVFGNH